MSFVLLWQRLKASLTASSSLNGSGLVVGSASTMVTARPEQSQILVQHPDAPSPAQPQVCCCPAPVLGVPEPQGSKPHTFLVCKSGLKALFFQHRFGTDALKRHQAENSTEAFICLTGAGVLKECFAPFSPFDYEG